MPHNIKSRQKPNDGFTILEISLVIFLFAFLMLMVGSSYVLAQKAYTKGQAKNELIQNIRVSLDRISREIRQSENIITILPATKTDPSNPPTNEIKFQDGHDTSQITYIRYYLNGTDLMREHSAYYFDDNPALYVAYNSVDPYGNPPTQTILSNDPVGEYFTLIQFWGTSGRVNITLALNKSQQTLKIDTSVSSRNQ